MGTKKRDRASESGRYRCGICGGLHAIGEDPHQLSIADELEEIDRLSNYDPDREVSDRADHPHH